MYISAPVTEFAREIGAADAGHAARTRASLTNGISAQQTTHFDLTDAHQIHSWLRATTTAFSRSIVGPGMTLARDPFWGNEASEEEYAALYNFYYGAEGRDFTNISDWYPFASKLYRTAGMYRLYGHATWELRRNGFDEVVSYDVIPGFVWPNCNADGSFRDPPFMQYLSSEKMVPLELDPDAIVFFMNPDLGPRLFASDFEALSEYVLPTDIYLSLAMRSLLENLRTPFGVWSLNEHATQEEVDNFSRKLDALYRGASNYGKSGVVVRGDAELQTFAPQVKDLPFQQGHNVMKDEMEGVSGVHGGKLGRTEEVSRSNLREIRRDYWETTQQPTVHLLAEQLHLLVHWRIFGIRGWRPVFKSPDFLTQVEKATVGMRGRQWGALSTNEMRSFVYDYPPLPEAWADSDYLWPTNMAIAGNVGALGQDPNDDGEEPVEEPDTDSEPPVRGDTDNAEERRGRAVAEMREYARFCLKRVGEPKRPFNWHYVPQPVVDMVDTALEGCRGKDEMKAVFDAVISGLMEA